MFRFIQLKHPEPGKSRNLAHTYLKQAPEAESVFLEAIEGLSEPEAIRAALVAAAASFSPLSSPPAVEAINPLLYYFGEQLSQNEPAKNEALIARTANLELLSTEQRETLWDNIYYQAITQQSDPLRDALVILLRADYLLDELRKTTEPAPEPEEDELQLQPFAASEIARRVASASVLIPQRMVSARKEFASSEIYNELDDQQRAALQKLHRREVLKSRIAENNALIEGIGCLQRKWNDAYNAAFNEAMNEYQFAQEKDLQEAETDSETDEKIMPERKPFGFTYEPNFDHTYIQTFGSEALAAQYEAIRSDCQLTPEDVSAALHAKNAELYREVLQTELRSGVLRSKDGGSLGFAEKPAGNSLCVSAEPLFPGSTLSQLFVTQYFDDAALALEELTLSVTSGSVTSTSTSSVALSRSENHVSFRLFEEGIEGDFGKREFEIGIAFLGKKPEFDGEINLGTVSLPASSWIKPLPAENLDGLIGNSYVSLYGISQLKVADYLKVEQELVCYVPGEVSHIENIMAREYKEKMSRSLTRSETTTEDTTERETEDVSDTSSTDRYEMQSEASRVLQEDQNTQLGTSVMVTVGATGSYSVNMGASANFGMSSSATDSASLAESYAREITERVTQRITEKVSQKRTTRMLRETEETSKHGFDNRKGDKHVTGVYRWVDKIYKNRLINYGKRLVYDFVIPEPARNFKYWITKDLLAGNSNSQNPYIIKPQNITQYVTKAQDINESNYTALAALYGADVEAPPQEYTKFTQAFSQTATTEGAVIEKRYSGASDFKMILPEGYYCQYANFAYGQHQAGKDDKATHAFVHIKDFVFSYDGNKASRGNQLSNNYVNGVPQVLFVPRIPISNDAYRDTYVEKELAVSVNSHEVGAYSVNVTAYCKRTPEAFRAWQERTYLAVMEAYQVKLDDYNQQMADMYNPVAATATETDYSINPAIARAIEQREFKRLCIEMMTRPFGVQTGINFYGSLSSNAYPLVLNPALQHYGNVVRFFEEAFDWDIMSYQLFPYYWAAKDKWEALIKEKSSSDFIFEAFLQAGFGRLNLPVKPGYERAVLYYFDTGKVWFGQNFGVAFSGYEHLYPSVMSELRVLNPGEQGYVERSWFSRIPSALTIIQSDSAPLQYNGLPCNCEAEDGTEVLPEQELACRIGTGNNLLGGSTGNGSGNTQDIIRSIRDILANGSDIVEVIRQILESVNSPGENAACANIAADVADIDQTWQAHYADYQNNLFGCEEAQGYLGQGMIALTQLKNTALNNGCDTALIDAKLAEFTSQMYSLVEICNCEDISSSLTNIQSQHTEAMMQYNAETLGCLETVALLSTLTGTLENDLIPQSQSHGNCHLSELNAALLSLQNDLATVQTDCGS